MENLVFVIFGGSGDLTRRKLIPALYNLFREKRVPELFRILGVGRTNYTDDTYRSHLREYLVKQVREDEWNEEAAQEFLSLIHYFSMDQTQESEYLRLKSKIGEIDSGCGNYIYYLATPPLLYEKIPLFLKSSGLNISECSVSGKGIRRVIVEKPFGYDLDSAGRFNEIFHGVFKEENIYRIDHFLGKETVQNILALRFANGILEPIWNRNYVERVEITAVENMGVGSRGGYYEGTGALRDMVQNHLVQLLALVAMEPPREYNEKEFRDEVVKVYKSLKPLSDKDIESNVIRGQYTSSSLPGKVGYRKEKGVDPESFTETFLAMKLFINNWRWEGVPFYIRTGKEMPTKVTEIVIHFRQTPHTLFSGRKEVPANNQLIIRIQPNEGALLKLDMKVPGPGFEVKQVAMDFTYDKLGVLPTEDAYSRLIEDCMNGEPILFTRSDAVIESWRFFDRILTFWKRDNPPLYGYPAGTWGPLESETLFSGAGKWTNPCKNLINTDLYCEL
ncbi:Glucose-6-phosphate 1-dehydrogenase [Bacteroidales bacterium CF]|jgi:glucose-6-phosphate 1-dehydrogenase|nr:Glucose-6-phosphate 1-dehydrogenase [Bacteroidales bacterium CF]